MTHIRQTLKFVIPGKNVTFDPSGVSLGPRRKSEKNETSLKANSLYFTCTWGTFLQPVSTKFCIFVKAVCTKFMPSLVFIGSRVLFAKGQTSQFPWETAIALAIDDSRSFFHSLHFSKNPVCESEPKAPCSPSVRSEQHSLGINNDNRDSNCVVGWKKYVAKHQ